MNNSAGTALRLGLMGSLFFFPPNLAWSAKAQNQKLEKPGDDTAEGFSKNFTFITSRMDNLSLVPQEKKPSSVHSRFSCLRPPIIPLNENLMLNMNPLLKPIDSVVKKAVPLPMSSHSQSASLPEHGGQRKKRRSSVSLKSQLPPSIAAFTNGKLPAIYEEFTPINQTTERNRTKTLPGKKDASSEIAKVGHNAYQPTQPSHFFAHEEPNQQDNGALKGHADRKLKPNAFALHPLVIDPQSARNDSDPRNTEEPMYPKKTPLHLPLGTIDVNPNSLNPINLLNPFNNRGSISHEREQLKKMTLGNENFPPNKRIDESSELSNYEQSFHHSRISRGNILSGSLPPRRFKTIPSCPLTLLCQGYIRGGSETLLPSSTKKEHRESILDTSPRPQSHALFFASTKLPHVAYGAILSMSASSMRKTPPICPHENGLGTRECCAECIKASWVTWSFRMKQNDPIIQKFLGTPQGATLHIHEIFSTTDNPLVLFIDASEEVTCPARLRSFVKSCFSCCGISPKEALALKIQNIALKLKMQRHLDYHRRKETEKRAPIFLKNSNEIAKSELLSQKPY